MKVTINWWRLGSALFDLAMCSLIAARVTSPNPRYIEVSSLGHLAAWIFGLFFAVQGLRFGLAYLRLYRIQGIRPAPESDCRHPPDRLLRRE